MMGITILGATGSIGVNTLDVIARHPERFQLIALTANRNVERLFAQCLQYHPQYAVLRDATAADLLHKQLRAAGACVEVLSGIEGLEKVARLPQVDCVMAAIVGAAGLLPTLAAVRAGKRILLANKETLVMAGSLFMEEVRQHNARLLPIDSEHNAVFQCLPANFIPGMVAEKGVRRIILTASGGPFRNTSLQELAIVTPEQACAHPNWVMGRKISVDSATMMNKGLEVIEANWLFGGIADRIEVLLHPQSFIHSLVEYHDGSVLAQMGHPDMRTPIAQALAWPDRIQIGANTFDLAAIGRLDFEPLSLERYPCLRLAYDSMTIGGTATAILNAANEIAVQAFLDSTITFTQIPQLIEAVMSASSPQPASDLAVVLAADEEARELTLQKLKTFAYDQRSASVA